jgi:hypothetical protein
VRSDIALETPDNLSFHPTLIHRKASFAEFFNKDELKRANIFYIFPEGCRESPVDSKHVVQSISRTNSRIHSRTNTRRSFKATDEYRTLGVSDEIAETPAEANINEQIFENVTEVEVTEASEDETTTVEATTIEPFSSSDDDVCADSCCEDQRPRINFPPPNSCCKSFSELVIPVDLSELEKISISEIAELSDELDPVRLLLKLLRILEKCRN